MVPKQLGPWYDIAVTYYQPFLHAYDDAPMWKVEPRNLPTATALKTAHCRAGPSRSAGQSETIAKFVVIDMFAKACAGKIDQGSDRRRQGAADADLQDGVGV
jgi:hypothetical protein